MFFDLTILLFSNYAEINQFFKIIYIFIKLNFNLFFNKLILYFSSFTIYFIKIKI